MIGNSFTAHFKELFSSSNPTLDDEMLSFFDSCISNEANISLCAIPSEQEIFCLAKHGFCKSPGS
jgi:hypothetical protein